MFIQEILYYCRPETVEMWILLCTILETFLFVDKLFPPLLSSLRLLLAFSPSSRPSFSSYSSDFLLKLFVVIFSAI